MLICRLESGGHRVYNLAQARRLYYLLYSDEEGGYIGNQDALNIANAFLNAIDASPLWISIDPASGVIQPGDSTAVTIMLDAAEVEACRHSAEVLTFGNGLDSSAIRTPVVMGVILNVAVEGGDIPAAFALESSYTNPTGANGTTLKYALPRSSAVRLTVYDVIGRRVAIWVDAQQPAR